LDGKEKRRLGMEVSENVGVKEYFEEIVPKMVEEQLSGTTPSDMEGTVFTVQFDIKGDDTNTYGITVKDAKDVEVSAGALSSPMIQVELDEDTWRKAVTGKLEGAMDMFTDMSQSASRTRYDAMLGVKGTMIVEMSMPDGTTSLMKIVFNDAASPETTFKVALEDWAKMQTGELAGPMAFMQGKLKIEGDMPFAMSLGNLMA
jgi:putative sterol carrier protein